MSDEPLRVPPPLLVLSPESHLESFASSSPLPSSPPKTYLYVDHRQTRHTIEDVESPVPSDTLEVPVSSEPISDFADTYMHIPIAFWKGVRPSTIRHPISHVCCLLHLSRIARPFAVQLDLYLVPLVLFRRCSTHRMGTCHGF